MERKGKGEKRRRKGRRRSEWRGMEGMRKVEEEEKKKRDDKR